jgi:hypothetical protein
MVAAIGLKAFALWLAILVVAILNGGFREAVLLKILERSTAFTLSGILLIACILLVSLLSTRWLGRLTLAQYLLLGAAWLALTLLFEFGFGLLRGQSVASLLDAYRFRDGNIWPIVLVVLVVVALAPSIAAFARGMISPGGR